MRSVRIKIPDDIQRNGGHFTWIFNLLVLVLLMPLTTPSIQKTPFCPDPLQVILARVEMMYLYSEQYLHVLQHSKGPRWQSGNTLASHL